MSAIMRATTINPQQVLPGAKPVSGTNYAEQGRLAKKRELQVDEDRARQIKDAKSREQREAFDKMIANPQAAEMIAQQYGITYDDNVRKLLQRPHEAKLMSQGLAVAEGMGIGNIQARQKFAAAFMTSGGDVNAANSAIAGMPLEAAKQPTYGHLIKTADGGIYNAATGQMEREGTPKVLSPSKDPNIPFHLRAQYDLMKDSEFSTPNQHQELITQMAPYAGGMPQAQPQQPVPVPAGRRPVGQLDEAKRAKYGTLLGLE